MDYMQINISDWPEPGPASRDGCVLFEEVRAEHRPTQRSVSFYWKMFLLGTGGDPLPPREPSDKDGVRARGCNSCKDVAAGEGTPRLPEGESVRREQG